MAYPLDNLGDYNKVREDLQRFHGCADALYNAIGKTAVAKATPSLIGMGAALGAAGVVAISSVAYGIFKAFKGRQAAIQDEPMLKAELETAAKMTDDTLESGSENSEGVTEPKLI